MKNKNAKLSVLIPVYNRSEYVKIAIESVLNQNFQEFEIICSDNASTDSTYEVLKDFEAMDSRIKVYRNERNLGPVLNWKNCLDHATGEYIHWLWSDDWIEKNFYEDAFKLMSKQKTRVLTTWNYRSDNPLDLDDKYISWQFSFPSVPGFVAGKKVLLMTRELPVSPAAYILPADGVRNNFYLDIPSIGNINPVLNGVGVDSLMVAGCCISEPIISVLQKPSVTFRNHENISSALIRKGTLGVMYMISHLWFISINKVSLNISDALILCYKIIRSFNFKMFSVPFITFLISNLPKITLLKPFFRLSNSFKSEKAFIKK